MLNKNDLHKYQLTGVSHILNNKYAGLFLDMGLGKTVTTLTAVNILMYEDFEVNKILLVAPKRVVESVWKTETAKWAHLKNLILCRVIGTEKQRKNALAAKGDIYLISRDNLSWLIGLYGGTRIPFDMLIIDESSSFKNPNSVRFKSLKAIQPCFKRVLILTGTPAPNGLIDLWTQLYLLDRGARLGKFIGEYRENYFNAGARNGAIIYNYNLRKNAEKAIHRKIGDICISMKAEDLLDLPGRIVNDIHLEFTPQLRTAYLDFEREQVLEIFGGDGEEAGIVSATNAAALTTKLLQFSNGAVYDEDKNVHEIHTLKLDEARQIVEQASGKPVLIAWTFKHDRDRLIKHLKDYNVRELKTEKDIQDWNNGEIEVLLMHPASGGHGLNLQAGGNTILWFSLTWSLELYQQVNARLDRQGQTGVVVINRLIVINTLDENIVAALADKGETQNALINAVKARVEKYLK